MKLLVKFHTFHPTNQQGGEFVKIDSEIMVNVPEDSKVWEIKDIVERSVRNSGSVVYNHLIEARNVITHVRCFMETP